VDDGGGTAVRILILDHYYESFLNQLYAGSDRPRGSYDEQWRALMATAFGTANFYSSNLEALGHPSTEVVINCLPLQKQWASENEKSAGILRIFPKRGAIPRRAARWSEDIVIEQVRSFRPDVVHVQEPLGLSDRFCRELHSTAALVTAQIASQYPSVDPLRRYDLVLTSLPNFVHAFREAGIRAEYFRLGFEASLLDRIQRDERYDVIFVGGISPEHPQRLALLEELSARLPFAWWGYGAETLPRQSVLRTRHQGAAWGLDAFRILASARICINVHAGFASPYANNMRLYEVTGVGTMLMTDAKDNLHELFTPGKEVAAYTSTEDLIEQAQYYLSHDDERRAITAAGQSRTLREHTYYARMQELVEIVSRYL
jgi:hypothetical protein